MVCWLQAEDGPVVSSAWRALVNFERAHNELRRITLLNYETPRNSTSYETSVKPVMTTVTRRHPFEVFSLVRPVLSLHLKTGRHMATTDPIPRKWSQTTPCATKKLGTGGIWQFGQNQLLPHCNPKPLRLPQNTKIGHRADLTKNPAMTPFSWDCPKNSSVEAAGVTCGGAWRPRPRSSRPWAVRKNPTGQAPRLGPAIRPGLRPVRACSPPCRLHSDLRRRSHQAAGVTCGAAFRPHPRSSRP